ncbi:hypothetical protein BGZ70_007081 [Mortierella alpina]|uniref:DUF2428 domain-containing protein n=1 Tax=Mortierella alpina TaxID=64518 RepID=A0A9P6M2L1_MORAP|nr:hypothetical protein BGZ70_007081 [Mortierella alpina]
MVLHQRTKQAFQSKDLSVPYSACWSRLLEPFEASAKDHPLVSAWRIFVNDSKHEQEKYGRTTSQQQAAAFKRLDQAVKSLKEQDYALLKQADFQHAFSQFMALFYFGSAKLASRKQIFALLQTLQPQLQPNDSDPHGPIVSALRSVITSDIFQIDPNRRIDIDMAWHQRALCLYTTLDYAMGRAAIHADMHSILEELSQLLHARIQITNVEVVRDHAPSEHTEAMQDLEFILKLILAMISRLIVSSSNGSASSSPAYGSSPSNQFEISEKHNPQLYIIRILKDAITISSSPAYHRDVSSISGMIFANLIDLTSPSIQEASRRIVGLVFGSNGQDLTFLPEIPRTMVAMDFGWNTYLGEKCGPGEEDAGMYMLGVVRGLLTNIRQEALVMPVENVSQWYAPAVFNDIHKHGLVLHEVLFHAIAYLCAASKDMSSKTSAFETMGHWLQQTKLHLGDRSSASAEMKQALASCINQQAQEKLTTYVLDYWEDPVDTVQHKVKNILELLLDIVYIKAQMQDEQITPAFVTQLLQRILMADSHRKSKYSILAILVGRVPIAEVMQLQQDALAQAIMALEQLATAPGAAVAINAMVVKSWRECLEQDAKNANVLPTSTSKKSEKNTASTAPDCSADNNSAAVRAARRKAMQPWLDFWSKSVSQALTTANDHIRKHLGHFILSPLLSTSPEAFWVLLDILSGSSQSYPGFISDEAYRFNAIVLAIKVARSLDLIDASHYSDLASTKSYLTDLDKPKIDISILHSAMYHASADIRIDVLGILCESKRSTTPVAQVEYELLKRFLPLNMNSVVPDFRQKLYTHLSKFLYRVRGNCYVLAREIARLHTSVGKKNLTEEEAGAMIQLREARVEETKSFLVWLQDHLFSSMYPGASFQRVSTSLRLLGMVIKTFGIDSTPLPPGSKAGEVSLFPFQLPIANEEHTKTLLGCLLNPFDHCREQALDILMTFKAPFAGYESKEAVEGLVRWGLDWLKSTRAGESDAGGLVLKTVFVKYAIELGWNTQLSYGDAADQLMLQSIKETGVPAVDFALRLQGLLRIQLEKAKHNQLDAAHHHPMHGTLIGLRYLFSSIDYASPLVTNHRPLWQAVHTDMMSLVESVCGVVMGVLSNPSPEGNIPATFTEMEESIDAVISSSGGDEFEQSGGPNHQVILSYCWRAIKESSSLMELVLSKATIGSTALKVDGILESSALDRAGALFRRLLTTIRHPGAFSSVFPAYISLCTRLLNSEDSALAALPRMWLEENLNSILSDSISVTRRSAGLPLCILAIVNAELSDNRRTLLPMVMRRVMAIAEEPVSADANQQVDLPQIHAMNVLRRLFMDAKLSTSVLPYVGQGLELSIRAFSSPSWAVRNCGVMLFSTLLHRVFGAKRVRDEHLAINGITSRELFARLEGLCEFLQGQLEVAVGQLLSTEASQDRVHPGVYPVLTLVSRLQPSLHADPADAVDGGMSAFVALVRRCAASAIWKTREMAARALTPLIASRDLMALVVDVLQGCLKAPISQNEIHGLLVQVQFLLRGHLLGEGVADRTVRRAFVMQFADSFGPVSERVVKTGCQLNRWMILSIYAEFVLGQEWMGRDSVEAEDDASMEMESEREEMKRLSGIHFKTIRGFILDYAIVGLVEEKQTYRQHVGGHLVRRLMARTMISASVLGVTTVLNKEQATELVRGLLKDQDYEVRLETLETLQALLETNRAGIDASFNVLSIHATLIEILFQGEENLECLRVEVALLSHIGGPRPFPQGSRVDIVEFWNRLCMRIDDEATGGVAVVEAILPATGGIFVQIWNDLAIDRTLRIDCLNRWAAFIYKHADEYQTLQLREAALESIAFFAPHFLAPRQEQPSADITEAYLKLFETLTWQLQDDEADVREEAAQIVSRGIQLPYAVSSEKALTLIYDLQLKLFAGKEATESQLNHLVESLISGYIGKGQPAHLVAESLQPSKMLFDKESPNLYREPLISMQLIQRSLETIIARPELPDSVSQKLASFQQTCIENVHEVQKAIQEWEESALSRDRSPWGVSSRKPIFEVLWRLASGGSLRTGAQLSEVYLEAIQDSGKVHPVVIEGSRGHGKAQSGRLFLIE